MLVKNGESHRIESVKNIIPTKQKSQLPRLNRPSKHTSTWKKTPTLTTWERNIDLIDLLSERHSKKPPKAYTSSVFIIPYKAICEILSETLCRAFGEIGTAFVLRIQLAASHFMVPFITFAPNVALLPKKQHKITAPACLMRWRWRHIFFYRKNKSLLRWKLGHRVTWSFFFAHPILVSWAIHPSTKKKRLNFSQASSGPLKFDANPENGLHRQQSHPDMMWNTWD